MHRILYSVLGGAFLFLISRCTTRTIDINLPTGARQPVVLGLMNTGDSVDVFVSQTAPARGQVTSDVYVPDASVQVLANGQVMADKGRYVGGGIYRLRREYPLQVGVAYQVRTTTSAFGTLISRPDTLPKAVEVQSFVTQGNSCTLSFVDPPGRHYYAVDIELYQNNERVFNVPNFIRTFSDELFEGQAHTLTVSPSNFATRYTATGEERLVRADFARIRLLSVSQQTHEFFASLDDYDFTTGSPEIEPTAPLSGIPGGAGYFGVGNSQTFYVYHFP